MREIIFRGKSVNDGRWVFGNLSDYGDCKTITTVKDFTIIDSCEVIPETVGQYTGLTDKNGKKIFEGDILKISFGKGFLKAVVKFGYYNQTDKTLKSHLGFYFDFVDSESYRKDVGFWTWTGKTFSKIEIIGNIHDNPELLKGGAENE